MNKKAGILKGERVNGGKACEGSGQRDDNLGFKFRYDQGVFSLISHSAPTPGFGFGSLIFPLFPFCCVDRRLFIIPYEFFSCSLSIPLAFFGPVPSPEISALQEKE